MFEVGRLCVKIAGRDAQGKCLVVDILDNRFVLIDGQTRRRKCNIMHLEPMESVLKIKKGASHDEVVKVLDSIGIKVTEKKASKEQKQKPIKIRHGKTTKTSQKDATPKEESKPKEKKKSEKKTAKN